jgi:hypothetical protein
VIATARALVAAHGPGILRGYAKVSFKTTRADRRCRCATARPARARPSPQPGPWRAALPCARDRNQPDDANLYDQASAAARFRSIPPNPVRYSANPENGHSREQAPGSTAENLASPVATAAELTPENMELLAR